MKWKFWKKNHHWVEFKESIGKRKKDNSDIICDFRYCPINKELELSAKNGDEWVSVNDIFDGIHSVVFEMDRIQHEYNMNQITINRGIIIDNLLK